MNRFQHALVSMLERPVRTLNHYFCHRALGRTENEPRWMGVPLIKYPTDTWVYQEVLFDTRPDLIIETGTNQGGSALFLASICDLLGHGRIVSVDIKLAAKLPKHPRIEFLEGSSTAPETMEQVRARVRPTDRVMVILDSDHSREHVLNELRLYGPLVSAGCYLVVEDTDVNGHPVFRSHGPGPMEALNVFLGEDRSFSVDPHCERFGLTFFPHGWLKKNG
jgi:cephalosporin hydroxylase